MNVIPARQFFGESRTPVLTVDHAGPDPRTVVKLATALGPFPAAANNYPGLRRVIDERDTAAWSYVVELLNAMTPYIAGAFDLDGFDLVEASFSLITTAPGDLAPVQRTPHFDSIDPDFYALMHYLADCDGTAFYRHRATGVERVSAASVDRYVIAARAAAQRAPIGYIGGSTVDYDRIGTVAGTSGRFVAYPGSLLHSGIVPTDFPGSADPQAGRLTGNFFIRARRGARSARLRPMRDSR